MLFFETFKNNWKIYIISVEVAKVLQYYNRWCNYNKGGGHWLNGWFKTTSLLGVKAWECMGTLIFIMANFLILNFFCVEILSIPINAILSYENSLFYIQCVMLTPPHMQVERRWIPWTNLNENYITTLHGVYFCINYPRFHVPLFPCSKCCITFYLFVCFTNVLVLHLYVIIMPRVFLTVFIS